MTKAIKVGDTFTWNGDTYTREPDDPCPVFPSERIRVKYHGRPDADIRGQRFPAEPMWFKQRGLVVDQE